MKNLLNFFGIIAITAMVVLTMTGCPNGTTGFTVTFNSQQGSSVARITGVESGAKISKPAPDPTRNNYTFGGWYKEAACTNAWNFETDTVTRNITLYAKWTAIDSGNDYDTDGRVTITGFPQEYNGKYVAAMEGSGIHFLYAASGISENGTMTFGQIANQTVTLNVWKLEIDESGPVGFINYTGTLEVGLDFLFYTVNSMNIYDVHSSAESEKRGEINFVNGIATINYSSLIDFP